jgi:predicted P-loop ATPase
MVEPIKLPVPASQDAEAHARADSERKRQLFAWAELVLKQLGLDRAVARASSVEALRRITLDAGSAEVVLAIRDALHPSSGHRQEHFRGLKEGGLKQVLKNRFTELKKNRETALRRHKPADWTDRLKLDKQGKIIGNLANLILILCESPDWKGLLAFDEFNVRVVARGPLPLEEGVSGGAWTDHHDALARVWFLRNEIKASAGDVGRAVQTAARFNPFNPVRDYFESLAWDGVPRLDAWLQTYMHVEDSAYVRAIGPRYLISAVARIYEPGCQVDHTLVLEGPQGKRKSQALRALAVRDEWFTDQLSHLDSKDASIDVAGVRLVEIAEMKAILKVQASSSKSFLTRQYDKYRPPYGRHTIRVPRQCVFGATINPSADGYLTDPTGARRFWPVLCRGTIDLAGLKTVCDQLHAEAVQRFKAGAPWWLETPELEALATAEQDLRFKRDDWEAPIAEWLGERTNVSVEEVLKHVFGLADKQHSQSAQTRVARILVHRLRFTKHRPRVLGGREYRYQRKPP